MTPYILDIEKNTLLWEEHSLIGKYRTTQKRVHVLMASDDEEDKDEAEEIEEAKEDEDEEDELGL